MNRNTLKKYAPQARQEFIKAVTARAARFGIDKTTITPMEMKGNLVHIQGEVHSQAVGIQRKQLEERIYRRGFDQTMEEIAYTWFNRFAAIRFMELHGYLDHGYRVLSHPEGERVPEILQQAQHLNLRGLDQEQVIELKLDGNQNETLYRLILIAQCNALHDAIPFLFEQIKDETELLLPDNLLHSDSLIRHLVETIPEEDWQEIEIIGWLYQFYISEKKAQVIGKVVKSEDIPAATQLFTPNWIVKYMVQNALGAQWLATYPDSSIREKMEYYIEPAKQTEEVQTQLAEITPSALNPEQITLIDPACGSGHILVEAYDLFKAIYQDRGYRLRDIPKLILEKNLYGLDIDDRAAQLAGFALLMKARADDRRILRRPVQLNVMALQSSLGVKADDIIKGADLQLCDKTTQSMILLLIDIFQEAKTLGSLIQIPEELIDALPQIEKLLEQDSDVDMFQFAGMETLQALVKQAKILAKKYDCVVMNPPYMSYKGMNSFLKSYLKRAFPTTKFDLFSCFIEHGFLLSLNIGIVSMVTMQSWMFLASHKKIRHKIIEDKILLSLAHFGARAFGSISGEVVQTAAFSILNKNRKGFRPTFFKLTDGTEEEKRNKLKHKENSYKRLIQDDFLSIPDNPISYWASKNLIRSFSLLPSLEEITYPRAGLTTGNNNIFQRKWWEIKHSKIGFGFANREKEAQYAKKWFPCNSGGEYRKWFGNNTVIVNWENDGQAIKQFAAPNGRLKASPRGMKFYFTSGVTWSKISSGNFAARFFPNGYIFDDTGQSIFPKEDLSSEMIVGLLCSKTSKIFLSYLSQTLSFNKGDIARIPFPKFSKSHVHKLSSQLVEISQKDWDYFETSWDFQSFPMLTAPLKQSTVSASFTAWEEQCQENIQAMKLLEEENNRLFIDAYGLQDELTPDVPEEQITLARPDPTEDMKRLISYAVGCMMGRYSLDEPGLIYAHAENKGFDPEKYQTFPATEDGIIPVSEGIWFESDITTRFTDFLSTVWPKEKLQENITFIADALKPKRGELPLDTIRRYFCRNFFKDHQKTYKKRPIYWLFSSGPKKAFECLIYLHRYNQNTLGRIRVEYVVPLQSRMFARIEQLSKDVEAEKSTVTERKLKKALNLLQQQREELSLFDEQLRHYADRRISLDLDDGVKVNYGKFGNLLADVKMIAGRK
ncbi:BREX-1 system adenine-specific DNA-methyltransferase PglX [Magnetococcales bacterium HHB-1]